MALSIEKTADLRDRLHNLDIDHNPEHRRLYESYRTFYLKCGEGAYPCVYEDSKGYRTVGIGFNMDRPQAREEWANAFKGKISFDKVLNKECSLRDQDIEQLLTHCLATREEEIKRYYGKAWYKLKANERLVIEDLWFCNPNLAKNNFYQHILAYTQTGDLQALHQAIHEVAHRSNPTKDPGTQNRRDSQAVMLSFADNF